MSTAAPSASPQHAPPDEKFWRRYSPHHEFSLSSFSSFALHLLVVGLAALLCMIPIFSRDNMPMPLDTVALAGPGEGGGRPDGDVGKRGDGEGGENRGDVQNPPNEKPQFDERVPSPDVPPSTGPKLSPFPDPTDVEVRPIELDQDMLDRLEKLRKTTENNLQGGSGGTKQAPKGTNPGTPGDSKAIDVRIERMVRWVMQFNTRDGKDYVRQLRAQGATLAIKMPDKPGKWMVYRDLSSPAKGEVEDLTTVKQIWWTDEDPESVGGLCRALDIKPVPKKVIAFLPVELEKQLLDLELQYAKGRAEEEIKETVFELKNKGGGRYEPVVIRQR